ncbi:PREDICTED: uncharacterized protein y4jA/y4nE/y4sE-like, partial [Priapulus caudatus]|uniref:Uncharacterized protein y4jA/y4nE/y4sE-like n=1 Tax=Priapulus caudatus TaxID=37621 RepID=A0ABM1F719_PRICU
RQGLSDFTHPRATVTIAGQPFPHLIYQYRLAYSGWRYGHVVRGGESYSALAEGLQYALHKCGGTPAEHRTDSLSAAYVNQSQKKQLTQSYDGLCLHYGMIGTTNNPGLGHENGAVETAHGSLKHRLDQAIKLRGSADFASITEYQALIDRCIERLNRYSVTRFKDEQKHLQPLPKYRFMDYSEISAKVTTSSTIDVKRCLYTVPSRLIGETLRIHLYHDKLIGFVGQSQVIELVRVYPERAAERARRIDYRHVIHSLAAKPQAFRFSNFRDELFPDDHYRQLWQIVDQKLPAKDACKWMVAVLRIAADHQCERELGQTLFQQAQANKLPTLKMLQAQYLHKKDQPELRTKQHDIAGYDELLTGRWVKPQTQGGTPCLSSQNLDNYQKQAIEKTWSYSEFLSKLCEQELARRFQTRTSKWTREARLPAGKSFATLDFTDLPKAVQQPILQLKDDHQWALQAGNVLLIGPSGVGKSHIAAALGYHLIERGVRVKWLSASELVQQLQKAKKSWI